LDYLFVGENGICGVARVARLEYLECVLLQPEPARIRTPEVGTTGERGNFERTGGKRLLEEHFTFKVEEKLKS
jgi:hypothetical protein